jgi:DNA-binding NarL/FixJ family response regulator
VAVEEKVKILVVVEDEPDMRVLVRVTLAADPRLEIVGEAADADQALALCRTSGPGLIILDHMLEGSVTGLELAPRLKEIAPASKILLFSALNLSREAAAAPAVDAFLLKTDIHKLLPTAQELLGLSAT